MNLDFGLAMVVIAVLIFYLRLIIIQRERAKRLKSEGALERSRKNKFQSHSVRTSTGYSIISSRRRDRIVAGVGGALILLGILLYAGQFPAAGLKSYWWVPTVLGILAFGWAFKL